MKRRTFITLLGGAAVGWPLAARAQTERKRRVGFLIGLRDDDAEGRVRFAAFRQGLESYGWIDGQNIEIVARFGTSNPDRNRASVAELLQLRPDVIVTSNSASVSALVQETRTIPIVFTIIPDPIAQGFVASLARPGGNVTGFTMVEQAMASKWVELLKQVAPRINRVAMLDDPHTPLAAVFARSLGDAASLLGIQSTTVSVRDDAEIKQAISDFAQQPNGGLILPPSVGLGAARTVIIELAARHRLPAVYSTRDRVTSGGLMSYGPDVLDLYRRSASYVDRILKGAKPADLPVQQPTKFELVINLKTAKTLGLDVPLHLQQLADEVIE
jgi:putative tryptophan/tyrosine transport system substrate-binding protein